MIFQSFARMLAMGLVAVLLQAAAAQEQQPKLNRGADIDGNIGSNSDQQQGIKKDSSVVQADIENIYESARKLLTDGASIVHTAADVIRANVGRADTYFQAASIPMRIFECVRSYAMLRCMKLFLLQRVEEVEERKAAYVQTASLKNDFADQFILGADNDHQPMGSLIRSEYVALSDEELNERLRGHFKRFFKDRQLRLLLVPGMEVMILPSANDQLQFSLRTQKENDAKQHDSASGRSTKSKEIDETLNSGSNGADGKKGGGGGIQKLKRKKAAISIKRTVLQFAVPIMILPAILMGSFLPFILPVLKMATIMTLLLNNSAFMAALMYAARTHANAQEEQHISYGQHGGFQ